MIIKDKYGSQLGYIVRTRYAGKERVEIDITDSEIKRTASILLNELDKISCDNIDFIYMKDTLQRVLNIKTTLNMKVEVKQNEQNCSIR